MRRSPFQKTALHLASDTPRQKPVIATDMVHRRSIDAQNAVVTNIESSSIARPISSRWARFIM
jgi:hypothetical protein